MNKNKFLILFFILVMSVPNQMLLSLTDRPAIFQPRTTIFNTINASRNPKQALDALVNFLKNAPQNAQAILLPEALTAIANKFPCSGYFLSYNLPVSLQKQFEIWYDAFAKKHPEEAVINTIMNSMSTFHNELAKIPSNQINSFVQQKTNEFTTLFKKLVDLHINLNNVVFCEDLDRNLLTYAFSKDLDNPAARQFLLPIILKSAPFNVNALDQDYRSFIFYATKMYENKLKETSDSTTRNQLTNLFNLITQIARSHPQ